MCKECKCVEKDPTDPTKEVVKKCEGFKDGKVIYKPNKGES